MCKCPAIQTSRTARIVANFKTQSSAVVQRRVWVDRKSLQWQHPWSTISHMLETLALFYEHNQLFGTGNEYNLRFKLDLQSSISNIHWCCPSAHPSPTVQRQPTFQNSECLLNYEIQKTLRKTRYSSFNVNMLNFWNKPRCSVENVHQCEEN